ncbi:MAG: hypothetical protein ACYSUK_01900 [Planctomycetota bacterium]|jgi:hypothetical protein
MSKQLPQRYNKYEDLPNHIKAAIRRAEVQNLELFINYKIPAYGYRSVLDMLNQEVEKGERMVLQYIIRYDADR